MTALFRFLDRLSDDAMRFAAALTARVPGVAAGVDPATRRAWATGGKFARALAAAVCGAAASSDEQAGSLLSCLARDAAAVVRDLAQIGLAQRALRDPAAFDAIAALAGSTDVRDRAAALRAAVVVLRGRPGGRLRQRAIDAVVAGLLDAQAVVCAGVVRFALGKLLPAIAPSIAAATLRRLRSRPEPEMRRRALSALTPELLKTAPESNDAAAAGGSAGDVDARV